MAQDSVRECMHCANSKNGVVVPRSLLKLRQEEAVGSVLKYILIYYLRGVEGGGESSAEIDRKYLLVMVRRQLGFWAGSRTGMNGCRHRSSTDQMVYPKGSHESMGQ